MLVSQKTSSAFRLFLLCPHTEIQALQNAQDLQMQSVQTAFAPRLICRETGIHGMAHLVRRSDLDLQPLTP